MPAGGEGSAKPCPRGTSLRYLTLVLRAAPKTLFFAIDTTTVTCSAVIAPCARPCLPGLHMMQRRTVHQAKCMRGASHLHLDAWYLSGIVSAFASRCSGARWHQIHRAFQCTCMH